MADRNAGRPWTAQEDDLLRQAVADYGESADWKTIAQRVPGRTNKACRKRWLHSLSPSIKKSAWTREEDEMLLSLYADHGTKWSVIARHITGRTDDACSKRYREALDPSLKKDEWTPEEDRQLLEIHARYGGKWGRIGQEMSRSGLGCRNRWRLLERKRASASHEVVGMSSLPCPADIIPDLSLQTDVHQTSYQVPWGYTSYTATPFTTQSQLFTNELPDSLMPSVSSLGLNSDVTPAIGTRPPTPTPTPAFDYASSSLHGALSPTGPLHVINRSGSQPLPAQSVAQQGFDIPNSADTTIAPIFRPSQETSSQCPSPHPQDDTSYQSPPNPTSELSYQPETPYPIDDNQLLCFTPSPGVSVHVPLPESSPNPSPATSISRSVSPRPNALFGVSTNGHNSRIPTRHVGPQRSKTHYRSPDSPRRGIVRLSRPTVEPGVARRLSSTLPVSSDLSHLAYACGYAPCWKEGAVPSASRFLTSGELSEHMRSMHPRAIDYDSKVFRCGLAGCTKGWKTMNGLQYHLQISKDHFRSAITNLASETLLLNSFDEVAGPLEGGSVPPESEKPKKTYPCPHSGCLQVYKQSSGLRYHLRHGHHPEPPAQLDIVPPALKRKVTEKYQKQGSGP